MKILHITGYKPMELNIFSENDKRIQIIKKALEKRITSFIEEGLEWVVISGQMGVELWTGEVVLDLKKDYDINLGVFPPFEDQESRWPENLQHKYQELQFIADHFRTIYEGGYRGPFQFKARDKWIVSKCDGSLILMDDEHPGSTVYFHKVAEEASNYPIHYITPFDLDDIVEEMRMTDDGFDL